MKLFVVLISFVFNINNVYAEDIDKEEVNDIISSMELVSKIHDKTDGVWMSSGDSEKMLHLFDQFGNAIDLTNFQNTKINYLQKSNTNCNSALSEYEKIIAVNRKMLDAVLGNLAKITPPEPSWYANKTAMYVYGIVTGVTVIFISSVIVEKTMNN